MIRHPIRTSFGTVSLHQSLRRSNDRTRRGKRSEFFAHLCDAYVSGKDKDHLQDLIDTEVAEIRNKYGEGSRELDVVGVTAGWALLKIDDPVGAENLLRPVWKYRREQARDAWSTFNAESLLGESLLDQAMYDEADELLIAGYEGLKDTADQIPEAIREQRLSEALDRLIRMAEETDDQEQLKKWLAEKDNP